jgi:hypothetical protein
MTPRLCLFVSMTMLASHTVAQQAPNTGSYRVTHTYALGGDGSWDYVVPDPPTHRLVIARQNRVTKTRERC